MPPDLRSRGHKNQRKKMKSHTFVLFEKDFAFIFSDNLTEKYFKSQGKKSQFYQTQRKSNL